jgi:hypothetical protein
MKNTPTSEEEDETLREDEDTDDAQQTRYKRRRWGLYTPFLLLTLAFIGWLASWALIRTTVWQGMDDWLAAEAREGRVWQCPERQIGGFPFRIEIYCTAPEGVITSNIGTWRARLNKLTVIGQVYGTGHYIAEAEGPIVVAFPQGGTFELNWRNAQLSLQHNQNILVRLSSVMEGVALRLIRPDANTPVILTADRSALHVRPNPQLFSTQGAYDLNYTAHNIANDALNDAFGGNDAMKLTLDAVLSQAIALVTRSMPESIDTWRYLGGKLIMRSVDIQKGERQVLARGELGLDAQRRLEGRIDLSATGIEPLIARLSGNNPRASALVAGGLALLGGQLSNNNPQVSALKSLPPIIFDKGRMMLGPLVLMPLPPLL